METEKIVEVVEVKEVTATYDRIEFNGKIIDGKYVTACLETNDDNFDIIAIRKIYEMLGQILSEETK